MKKQRGITLIALVITIVVLIILAGVAINLTLGEKGIFKRAEEAKLQYEIAQAKEELDLKIAELQVEKQGSATLQDVVNMLKNEDMNYVVSLTQIASITGVETIGDANEIYVVYKIYQFKIYNTLETEFISIVDYDEDVTTEKYTVTLNGENVTSNGANTVKENETYTATLTPENGYEITSVVITMAENTLSEGTDYTYENSVITITKVTGNISITVVTETMITVEIKTTHTVNESLPYSWEQLEQLAEIISDNDDTITEDTLGVNITIGGTPYTIGVGDKTTVTYDNTPYTVRILGFNHDTLVDNTAYKTGKTYETAGISFEFVDIIYTAAINSNTNTSGWGGTALRSTLNSMTELNKMENKDCIKPVKKIYLLGNKSTTTELSSDSLWLLSCSEIWDNPGETSAAYGYAAGEEGKQYKYYKLIDADAHEETTELEKKYNGTLAAWWIRSPYYDSAKSFCAVNELGKYGANSPTYTFGIAPGFSI